METKTYTVVGTVPIPSGAKRVEFPFASMQVGDSFDIGEVNPKRVKTASYRYGKATGKKFTVRYPEGTLCKTMRCWRIA